jgi:hypothetical protein
MPSGPAYHRRRSCAARRTRAALLLPRPPHGWRELAVPSCTVAPSSSSHPAATFASQLLLPGSPRHNRPSASARTEACPHWGLPSAAARTRSPPCPVLATSRFSTSSSQCCLTSCAAFPSTASDVLHARPRCSRADPPAAAALQLLPHRARPPCTPTRSRPELAQRGHRLALHVAAPSSAPAPPVPHPHTHACTPSPCTATPPPLVVGPALALALPRRSCARPSHALPAPPAPVPHMRASAPPPAARGRRPQGAARLEAAKGGRQGEEP